MKVVFFDFPSQWLYRHFDIDHFCIAWYLPNCIVYLGYSLDFLLEEKMWDVSKMWIQSVTFPGKNKYEISGEILEKLVVQGKVEGKRSRGRSPKRWLDQIEEVTNRKLERLVRDAEDREEWRSTVVDGIVAVNDGSQRAQPWANGLTMMILIGKNLNILNDVFNFYWLRHMVFLPW